jgi:hypothetical protein
MAIWDLAIAWTSLEDYSEETSPFPRAIVQWIGVKGGQSGGLEKGYGSFAEALGELMSEGWDPFSAHRWEDFDAYGPHPLKTTGSLPIRDYVWFRRPVKSTRLGAKRNVPVKDAQVVKP